MSCLAITALPALETNYIWMLVNQDTQEAVAIDPGSADVVFEFLQAHDLSLHSIWVTHVHSDHTGGVLDLYQASKCAIYSHVEFVDALHFSSDFVALDEGDTFNLWGNMVDVWRTDGHSPKHLTYLLHAKLARLDERLAPTDLLGEVLDFKSKLHVFCADTVFCIGAGAILGGNMWDLSKSVKRFLTLDDTVYLYPAHEYTKNNLDFAQYILKRDFTDIKARAVACLDSNCATLPTRLSVEKTLNPFFLAHLDPGLFDQDEGNVAFAKVRLAKDQF